MGHVLNLELQSSSSGYQLKVVATFDGGGFANGGYTKDWNGETQEWTVDVIAASASPGVDEATYIIPFGIENPIPTASQSILVKLVNQQGHELASDRIGGGGSTDDTDASSKPFPEEELLAK